MNSFFMEHMERKGHYTMQKNHFHPYYEIYYLLKGERFYFIKDRTYPITKGGLVFIGKYDLHKTADTGVADHERILIQFDDSFLASFTDPLLLAPFHKPSKRLQLTAQEQSRVETLLFQMLKEYENKLPGWKTYLQASLAKLLIGNERLFQEESSMNFEYASPLHRKISEIVEYINVNYGEEITLSSLSRSFYISPYYLSRKFKEVTGFSFVEYVNSVRIKEAQTLLRQTDEQIIRIAELTGFDNISHFGRVFKQMLKISPMEYRKSVRKLEQFPHE
ncbi:helix-turn-helix transcriptional regulator [Paenibacillus senegalensis]|uniref:helix-turn-helix transcriptional regulator n=1 Tax=Paenibacillus senegalensis TaxID=1465766 RepID=UPI0002897D38|nr:AraC family transcriptional regulator [Paenibacillus senegalensis]